MRTGSILLLAAAMIPQFLSGAQSNFDAQANRWVISGNRSSVTLRLAEDGAFVAESLQDLESGDYWTASAQRPGPIRLQAGNEVYDATRMYTLVDQYVTQLSSGAGVRQFIVLQDVQKTAQFTVMFDVYDDQPVVRYRVRYRNITGAPVYVTSANMLPWSFSDAHKRYTALRVNQWSTDSRPEDFEPLQTLLDTGGSPVQLTSGAHGDQCGWIAVRDGEGRGLFGGWEFDGRAKASILHQGSDGYIKFSASILDLNHPVAQGEEFVMPGAFLGTFHGDFDEAGFRTQRFVEAILAKPAPAAAFPYVSWDSWGYEEDIDEATLRRNADLAAAAGTELFVVDLGWARAIGDWYADPQKFPSGLGALGDYVHSLGMKFGLHFALAEADPSSPVLRDHPDWTASVSDGYHGAASLCLAHQPARDWVVQQAIRLIDEYHVDWILQDGENMVKECTKSGHTHDPADSNYANSVNGLNATVQAIQTARPNVLWENCENGGNMMTFNMVKMYVTSITNDASGSLASRRAVYGATYPFPPRYAERYMPGEEGLTPYVTHSYRFGGNWAIMNRLADLTPDQLGFLGQEITRYKAQRSDIAGGKVFHHAAPSTSSTDAIQSYNADTGVALAVVTRAESAGPQYTFRPKGLDPDQRYAVFFDIDPSVYSMSGAQLMANGVRVLLPTVYSSDVVHIQRQ
jgi:alpha-galactosidase